MRFFGKLLAYPLLAVNIVAALLFVFSCYGSLAAPVGRWPFASLAGLAFPFLFILNLAFLIIWLLVWKKAALLPVITFIACISPTLLYFPFHFTKSGSVEQPFITVMTYNTEGFGTEDNKDSSTGNPVLQFILGHNPDIIILQEATRDIISKASRDKAIKTVYPYMNNDTGVSNLACISKFPIVGHEYIPFEKSNNGCLYLRILIGDDTLALYNCHLQSISLQAEELSEYRQFIEHPTDSTHYDVSKKVIKKLLGSTSQRAGQARMIAERAKAETARFTIVCGDFNDTPLSYSHRVFDRFMNDAFAKSGVGMGITYHEHKLYYRIDHIFCSKNITPLHTWIDRTQKDSDHYPVITKIRF